MFSESSAASHVWPPGRRLWPSANRTSAVQPPPPIPPPPSLSAHGLPPRRQPPPPLTAEKYLATHKVASVLNSALHVISATLPSSPYGALADALPLDVAAYTSSFPDVAPHGEPAFAALARAYSRTTARGGG